MVIRILTLTVTPATIRTLIRTLTGMGIRIMAASMAVGVAVGVVAMVVAAIMVAAVAMPVVDTPADFVVQPVAAVVVDSTVAVATAADAVK